MDPRPRIACTVTTSNRMRRYLWDGARLVAETNAAGTVLARFVYGARAHVPDYLLAAGVTYRLVTDERGSVRLVVNTTTGAIVQRISYDPWGRVTADTNPGFQPFGYAGGLTDTSTGLVRFGVRDYDPATTRWLSRDTIGFAGGTNHYTYADGDPLNQIDPSGHSATACFADVLGLAGMIPVIGTAFDIASALLYLSQGKWGDAALAMAGIIIPLSATQLKGMARYGDDALALADEAAEGGERLLWTSWQNYPKVAQGGREYAQIGDRLYTSHAVDRLQPSGLGTPAGATGAGRRISPNFVENVLSSTRGVPAKGPNGEARLSFTSGTVQVITEDNIVITVITR